MGLIAWERAAAVAGIATGSVTPVLQAAQRMLTRHLLGQAGLNNAEGHGDAVTLIQRFGSAANLNIHLHCLVQAVRTAPHALLAQTLAFYAAQ